jgi:hypothetical protein
MNDMSDNNTTPESSGTGTESQPEFITKRVFSARMAWSVRTTDNFLRQRKIPFCKLGKIVRIPWPEAREHLLRNYKINAR